VLLATTLRALVSGSYNNSSGRPSPLKSPVDWALS
jgi:hypothetical protein